MLQAIKRISVERLREIVSNCSLCMLILFGCIAVVAFAWCTSKSLFQIYLSSRFHLHEFIISKGYSCFDLLSVPTHAFSFPHERSVSVLIIHR